MTKHWNAFRFPRSAKAGRRQPLGHPFRPRLEALEVRVVPSNTDVLQSRNDHFLTAQNRSETDLTPANVNPVNFGRLFTQATDGYVYAQPLYKANLAVAGGTHNVVFVATEHDSLYAFDADSATAGPTNNGLYWKDSFINPGQGINPMPGADTFSGDIQPEVGITGTPVIDPASNTIYLVAKTKEHRPDNTDHYVQKLHALDLSTGAEKFGGPVVLGDTTGDNNNATGPTIATVAGTGDGSVNGMLTFNARKELQRPGLTLNNGIVWVAFASHGDNGPYHGWVLGYNASNLSLVKVFNTSPNAGLSGIWQSGGPVAIDPNGALYFATGNGPFDAFSPGAHALGQGGGALGYQGIGNSASVRFRTFPTETGLGANGSFGAGVGLPGFDFNANSRTNPPHQYRVTLTYNATAHTLAETITDVNSPTTTFSTTYTNVDLSQQVGGPNAYVGFTGATGGLNAQQDIINWTYQVGGQTLVDHANGFGSVGDLTANGSATFPGAASPVGVFANHQDIGTANDPSVPGTATYNPTNQSYTLTARGSDIGFSTPDVDHFQYAYGQYSGDGEVVVRVASLSNTNFWTKAVIQIRGGLANNAQDVQVVMSPHNQSEMTWRDNAGGGTGANEFPIPSGPLPGWIRLVRQGSTFMAYWAPDNGGTPGPWTLGGTHTTNFTGNVYIGLGLTSHDNTQTATATFDHLSITGFTQVTDPNAVARLTAAQNGQTGSFFTNTPVSVANGFTTTFTFQETAGSNPIADGLTFTVQNAPAGRDYGDSVLKLDPSGAMTLVPVADSFTPFNQADLNARDADLGSGGTMLLPDAVGSTAHPHLMVETGKEGKIYLIDRDRMGGYQQGAGGGDAVVQVVTAGQAGVWGNPAFFQDSPTSGILYYHGSGDVTKAYRISNGVLSSAPDFRSATGFGFPGGQPSLSSNGFTNAIDWELQVDQYGSSGPAILHAYNALTLQELYNSNQTGLRDRLSGAVKFTVPTISNGKVFVGSQFQFSVFGLFPAHSTPPAAPTGLTAQGLTGTTIGLSWTAPVPNDATSIHIERSTDGTNFTEIAIVPRDATAYTDTNLSTTFTYSYRIRANNQAGNSGYSNVAQSTVAIPGPVVSLVGASSAHVDISWTGDFNDHYAVERSVNGGAFTVIAANLPATQHTYSDTTVTQGNYLYRVRGFNSGGASAVSPNTAYTKVGPVLIDYLTGLPANPPEFQANGSALFAETTARLTNANSQAGSVFSTFRVNDVHWSLTFKVRLHEGTQPNYADGFAFVFQTNSPSAVGQGTGGLGYQGIPNSVAIKFDTFNNEGENGSGGSTGLFFNGDRPTVPHAAGEVNLMLDAAQVNLLSQSTKTITLSYDAATLTLHETIADPDHPATTFTHDYTNVDLAALIGSPTAYVGFTGSTGSNNFWELEDVTGLRFQTVGPAAPASLRTTVIGTSSATLAWNSVSADEQGYRIERATNPNGPFVQVAQVGAGVTTYNDTNLAAGVYYYRVRAFNADGNSAYSNVTFACVAVTDVLVAHDAGFGSNGDLRANGTASFPGTGVGTAVGVFTSQRDFGNPPPGGNATFANGTYTVTGTGSDIWDTADHFRYVYRPMTGDGEVVVRVASEQPTDFWTKAGIMIRESLTDGSRNAFMFETPHGTPGGDHDEPVFQWRDDPNGGSADFGNHQNGIQQAPVWLRLVRSGNSFSGFWAHDNGDGTHGPWNEIGTPHTINMASGVYVGLAVTAHVGGTASATVAFDHLTITPQTAVPLRLTDGNGGEAASAFGTARVPVEGPFTTSFTFQMRPGSNPIADGLMFVLQNDPRGTAALGGSGGALGYGPDTGVSPIVNSVGIKFDAYKPNGNHSSTGLYINGQRPDNDNLPPGNVYVDLAGSGIDFNAAAQDSQPHTFQVTLTYIGTNLTETITDLSTGATFTHVYSINLATVIGNRTAYAGFTGGTGGLTSTIDVTSWTGDFCPPAATNPTHFGVSVAPSTVAGQPINVTVTALDAAGNPVPGYRGTIHFTSTDPAAGLPDDYTFTADDAGVHVFQVVLRTAGGRTVTATDPAGGFVGTSGTVNVTAADPASFTVVGFPTPVTAGTPGNVTLTVKDAFGNTVTGYTGTVYFFSSDPQAALPGYYTFTTTDQGTHTFSVTLFTAGAQSVGAYDVASLDVQGRQDNIAVTPAAAALVSVTGYPATIRAGTIGTFTLTVTDAYGNTVPDYTGTVTFFSTDPQALLPDDYTFTAADHGRHTFAAILYTAGAQSVGAYDLANPDIVGEQDGINVTPGDPVGFTVDGFPNPVAAGTLGLFTVTVVDAYGNAVPSYTGTVYFYSSDPRAILPDPYTFTATDQGTHTFAAVLFTPGIQFIKAYDPVTGFVGVQDGIEVDAAAPAPGGAGRDRTLGTALSLTGLAEVSATDQQNETAGAVTRIDPGTLEAAGAPAASPASQDRAESVLAGPLDQVLADWDGALVYGLPVDDLLQARLI